MGEGQIADRPGTDRRAMSACQSEPMQDAIRGVVCEACHRPEAMRSLRSAKASRTEARGLRMVSKKVCLSALDVRRQVAQ
jgi:hypothetical protein